MKEYDNNNINNNILVSILDFKFSPCSVCCMHTTYKQQLPIVYLSSNDVRHKYVCFQTAAAKLILDPLTMGPIRFPETSVRIKVISQETAVLKI